MFATPSMAQTLASKESGFVTPGQTVEAYFYSQYMSTEWTKFGLMDAYLSSTFLHLCNGLCIWYKKIEREIEG